MKHYPGAAFLVATSIALGACASLPKEDKIISSLSLGTRVANTVGFEYRRLSGSDALITPDGEKAVAEKADAELAMLARKPGDGKIKYHFENALLACDMKVPVFVTDTGGPEDHIRLMQDTGQIKDLHCKLI